MSATSPLSPAATPWAYRPHLDGLRSVAVYVVVLFHAGLDSFVGGFVGVDLFFVLSGYLVTNVLLTELATDGSVRVGRFYARRARRLIPAAALAITGTAAAAVLVMPHLDRTGLADDARASSLWFANWHFIGEASDYFAVDGPESPYLHFWSLSIEEQFYLAFPLVVLAAWRRGGRLATLGAVVAIAAAASLAAQLWFARSDVNRAYLGTDTRVYQILLGSLLAMALWRWNLRSSEGTRWWPLATRLGAPIALAAFVLVSSSWVDASASTRGLLAAGISLLLIVGLEAADESVLARMLAAPPVRYLGQISYGTYLWHWPVVVLASTVVDMSPISAAAVSAILGTALAALSAALVELPLRSAPWLDRRPRVAISGGIVLAAVSGVVIAPALLEWERRPVVTPRSSGVATTSLGAVPDLDWEAIARGNPDVPDCESAAGVDCWVTSGDAGTILLIGDSHARMLIPGFEQIAAERDLALAVDFSPSCPWQRHLLAGEPGDRFSPRCERRRPVTYNERIAAIDPDLIVVAGFPRSIGIGGVFTDNPDLDGLGPDELVATTTSSSIDVLATGGRNLLVIEPVPVLPADPLACLSAADDVGECTFIALPAGVEEAIERDAAAETDGIETLDLDSEICPDGMCPAIIDGVVVHRDAHHVTPEFARSLGRVLGAAIERFSSDEDPNR